MSKKILIGCDSTADMSPELYEKYGIKVLPLSVFMNDVEYKDMVDVRPQDIFDNYEKNKCLPKTAAVSLAELESFYEENLKKYDEIVYFSISSEFSSSYQNSVIAANGNPRIFPIDSRNLSTGIGLLVLKAAEFAASGMSGAEIDAEIKKLIPLVDTSFVVDTLEFLYKGGRCSGLAAFGANVLKLHPCIEVKDGKMGVGKKYRGAMDKALEQYAADRLTDVKVDNTRVFITTPAISEQNLNAIKNVVEKSGIFKEILVTYAGCTVTSHCGYGTIGVLFIRKPE